MNKAFRRKQPRNSLKTRASGFVTPAGQFFAEMVYDDLGRVNVITQPDATTSSAL